MTKKEIYTELIQLGFVKESIDGLLKSELKGLLDNHKPKEAKEKPLTPSVRITHRFATEVWLANGIRVFKRDNPKKYKEYRVNGFLRKVDGKWQLA